MKKRTTFPVAVVILVLLSSILLITPSRDSAVSKADETEILNMVDSDRVFSHMVNITSLGSRVTGYEGNLLTADYIAEAFREYGLTVKIHRFKVTVPLDLGTKISVTSPVNETFEAYALWPNGIQTCPVTDLEGRLIYMPIVTKNDFDGKPLRDSIVLMEFDSGDNWLFAADMGAKAFIFIEPNQTTNVEAMRKFVEAPLYFPRLYVKRDVANQLIALNPNSKEVHVKLHSKMVWRTVEAENILGIVNGTQPNDIIVISSHYDTWSIVPKVSCGAEDAIGISTLLEIAKYYASSQPRRTVWLLALSGHWQGLAGVREFMEDYYFSPEVQNGTIKPYVFLNLGPFSWDTDQLQLLARSYYSGAGEIIYAQFPLRDRYMWIVNRIYYNYLVDPALVQVIKDMTGKTPTDLTSESLGFGEPWGSMQKPYILESEPILSSGAIGISIVSSPTIAYDNTFGTPENNLDQIDMKKLKPQFTIMSFILNSLINEDEWEIKWDDIKPERAIYLRFKTGSFITVFGKVLLFNYTIGWYQTVPNAIVLAYSTGSAYPFSRVVTLSDENGAFEVHGVPAYVLCHNRMPWKIEAYLINETDGTIVYAPDLGIQGSKTLSSTIAGVTHPINASVVVANLRSITLFDMFDPNHLRPLFILDPRTTYVPQTEPSALGASSAADFYVNTLGQIKPLDFELKSELLTYGVVFNQWETVASVFAPPHSKVAITLSLFTLEQNWPLFLANSNASLPEGYGIEISGKPVVFHFTAHSIAQSMYYTTEHRYEILKAYNVRSLSIEDSLRRAYEYLHMAELLYDNNTYSKAHGYAIWSIILANRAYQEVMSLVQDSAIATTSLFVIIVIACLYIERLLISSEKSTSRLISTAALIALFSTALALIHPSFHIMSNSVVGFFGSVLIILFVIVVVILLLEGEKVRVAISTSILGKHVLKRGFLESLLLGSSSSTRFMRRHRFRTTLTLLTTFIITASLISLTSVSVFIQIREKSLPYTVENTLYENCIFIERDYGLPPNGPLSPMLPSVLHQIAEDRFIIMPRLVYYPQTVTSYGGVKTSVQSQNGSIFVSAILGISPNESAMLAEKTSAYFFMNFTEKAYNMCFLTTAQARALNVSVGDNIIFNGYRMFVMDILEDSLLNQIKELNGVGMGPIDPIYVDVFAKELAVPPVAGINPAYVRLAWDQVLIVPERFAEDMGGYVASINIIPKSGTSIKELEHFAQELTNGLSLNVWIKAGAKATSLIKVPEYYTIGFEPIMMLLIIGVLNILMSILATVGERTNEYSVLTISGASPLSIISMVMVESIIYALLGSIFGYFTGYIFNILLAELGALPAYFPFNYASISVVLSLGIIIAVSLLGAIWPALKAAKSATPSLERKWEFPTKPQKDSWNLPLPFRASTKTGAIGLLYFLSEYFRGGGKISSKYIVDQVGDVQPDEMKLDMEVRHVPYEAGIESHVEIRNFQEEENFYLNIYLKRIRAPPSPWKHVSYYLVDAIRKQFMLWNSLNEEERKRYILTSE